MTAPDDLPRYAALVAPVIDRLHAGVHRVTGPRARELSGRLGLRPGCLVDLRYVLADRPLTAAGLASVYRYRPSARLAELIAAEVTEGRLTPDEHGAVHATDQARDYLGELYRLHDEVTADRWEADADRVPALAAFAGRLLAAAAATGGPAFTQMSPPYEPAEARPGLLLFNRLAALRYHRADAHAAAWQAAGLTADQIVAMPPGPDRDAIEAETNRLAAPPFATLTPEERLTLLSGSAPSPADPGRSELSGSGNGAARAGGEH